MSRDDAVSLLTARSFGLLVVPTAAAPFGVHVPFLVDDGPAGTLRVTLHVARANPVHELIGGGADALLVCQGPDSYISPDWYGTDNQVPTWLYASVHLKGRARVLPAEDNRAHVDRLSGWFEERLRPKTPWTSAKMDQKKLAAMLKAIVAIALDVTGIEAQNKLIQHKGETEHAGAVAGLRGLGTADALAIATMLEAVAQRKFG